MFEFLWEPWPWYVAGPLIGLMVPVMFLLANKAFGVSSSLRHTCAACAPGDIEYFRYDWKKEGLWNLVFVLGILVGGFLGGYVFAAVDPVAISEATKTDLRALGVEDFSGLVPSDVFNWRNLLTLPGLAVMIGGGFLVGFGARYASGCTSGHAISGLSNMQLASLLAVIGFFAGGLLMTHFILPLLLV
jgi:uncharacterized protein